MQEVDAPPDAVPNELRGDLLERLLYALSLVERPAVNERLESGLLVVELHLRKATFDGVEVRLSWNVVDRSDVTFGHMLFHYCHFMNGELVHVEVGWPSTNAVAQLRNITDELLAVDRLLMDLSIHDSFGRTDGHDGALVAAVEVLRVSVVVHPTVAPSPHRNARLGKDDFIQPEHRDVEPPGPAELSDDAGSVLLEVLYLERRHLLLDMDPLPLDSMVLVDSIEPGLGDQLVGILEHELGHSFFHGKAGLLVQRGIGGQVGNMLRFKLALRLLSTELNYISY